MHKYALSRITTAVDTALRITAVLRLFIPLAACDCNPPPALSPTRRIHLLRQHLFHPPLPPASVVLPGRAQRPNTEIMQTAQQQNKHFDISPKGALCRANQIPDSCLT